VIDGKFKSAVTYETENFCGADGALHWCYFEIQNALLI
jgi:hypothetical protein